MTIMFDDSKLQTLDEVHCFLGGTGTIQFTASTRQERAQWVRSTLVRFKYAAQCKMGRGILRQYLERVTGYSRAQVTRHIAAYLEDTPICVAYRRHRFPHTYTDADRELLAEVDNAHRRPSGIAVRSICAAMQMSGDVRYGHLAGISCAHLYRLRQTRRYRERALTFEHTKSRQVPIGERRKPDPKGMPGFLRVDTVHQGDVDSEKGVYHINMIDVITQWEVILSVEQISEKYVKPILKEALSLFPFRILGFHSDNGSEYINDCVSRILRRQRIEQTKGRPRHTNDNALIESKNGAIIRKWLGYWHIPRQFAPRLNAFHREHFMPYLNYHRPCAFPTVEVLPDGKKKVRYRPENYMTPCERLLSLDNVGTYLRPGITAEHLRAKATEKNPNQAAHDVQRARAHLFTLIHVPSAMIVPPLP